MDRIRSDMNEEDVLDSGFVSMAAQEQPPGPSPSASSHTFSTTCPNESSNEAAVATAASAATIASSPLSTDDTSSPLYQSDPWSNADNYESLDLSFDDIADLGTANSSNNSNPAGGGDPTAAAAASGYATAAASSTYDPNNEELYPTCKKGDPLGGEPSDEEAYILGTLIVRVVAARNLSAADSSGFAQAVGGILFGTRMAGGAGGGGVSGGSRGGSGGSVNPYASVRFGTTTQRTSQVFGTPDPIWPRAEAMYLDVTHPPPEAALVATSASPKASGSADTGRSIPGGKDRARLDSSTRASPTADSWSDVDPPVLTVGIFHSNADMSLKKQKYSHGDSNDVFLGMATVNLTHLLTGKCRFDEWLPLQGGPSSAQKSSVRLVCEYEPSDPPPHKGDVVQFTRFCRPCDLYPLTPFGTTYTVEEGCNDNDLVLIQSTSREGWYVPL